VLAPLALVSPASAGLLPRLSTSTSLTATTPTTSLLSPLTPVTGVTQLVGGTTGLVSGATASLTTVRETVTAVKTTVDPSIASSITKLQARAQAAAAKAAAVDGQGATEEVAGAVADVQGEAGAVVAGLSGVALTQGLTNGLTVAQNVLTPVCSILGTPVALAQGVGTDLTQLYPLAEPIQPLDTTTNELLRTTYERLYDTVLGSVNGQLGAPGATAGAVLSLLKYNWTTTYHPPGGGEPRVTTTKALLNVPTPIDVDGSGSFDLCGTTTLALDAASGKLKLTQQIAKLPLSKAVLPVDISGALLGVIGFGYETRDSTAPTTFTSAITIGSGSPLMQLDNSYTVHRGLNLSVPPTLSKLDLPAVPTLTSPAPEPRITQVIGIGGSALQLRFRNEDQPGTTRVGLGLTPALKVDYAGSAPSKNFAFTTAIGTIRLGMSSAPTGTSFSGCVSGLLGANGACSTAPDTTGDVASLRFSSSAPTRFDLQQTIVAPPAGQLCPTLPLMDAHLTGTGLALGTRPGTTTAGSGRLWADTDGPVNGCLAVGNATRGVLSTLPEGFTAQKRQATYRTAQTFGFTTGTIPEAKTGTITCPAGTTVTAPTELIVTTYPLTPALCSLPPANTVAPSITGQPLVDATLTAVNGTWTPGAPNTPAYTHQWNRCDAEGAACAPIGGATASTYVPQAGDVGRRLTVTVTGTNLDGSAKATSSPTAVIALPPAPENTARPVVSAVTPPAGVGRQLRTTNGTWRNGVREYRYDWLRCAADGTDCASIGAEDRNTYTPSRDDLDRTITVKVTAINSGGSASATAAGIFIPPPPVLKSPPAIFSGASNATGKTVLTGDSLTARPGTFEHATSFAFAWLRCNEAGEACAPIAGARTSGYAVSAEDVGSTLRVTVTASNVNGSTEATSAATGVAAPNDLELRPTAAVVDGDVHTVAPSDRGTLYVGGDFDTAGAPTGGAGVVASAPDAQSRAVGLAALTEGGSVHAVAPDGDGGYYLGGSFTRVKGQPCLALARITAGGALDSRVCRTGFEGEVRAVSAAHGLVAIGGDFRLGDRTNLAFVTPAGDTLSAPEGDPSGPVLALTHDAPAPGGGTSFYAGGTFDRVGETPVKHLAKFTVSPGPSVALAPWAANVNRTSGGTAVRALSFIVRRTNIFGSITSTPLVLVGGSFDQASSGTANPSTRGNAAAFSTAAAPALVGWNPNANGAVRALAVPVVLLGDNASGSIYLGGDFTTLGSGSGLTAVNGLGQSGISALGGSNGAGTGATAGPTTNYKPAIDGGGVRALAAEGGTVHAGGAFTSVGGVVRHRLAAFKPAGTAGGVTAAEAWDPNAGAPVHALVRAGGAVIVGGAFDVLGGETRDNLAELAPADGITTWNPGANGPVRALLARPGRVTVGGAFTRAGGQTRANLAELDAAGAATDWTADTDGSVLALAAQEDATYVGGSFTTVDGQPRPNLARVGADGAVADWAPAPDGAVRALVSAPGTVTAGGAFATAGGAPRARLARLDAATGAATDWTADVTGTEVRALSDAGGVLYLGGDFSAVAGEPRANAAAVDDETGEATEFAPDPDGTVHALLPLGSRVVLGGAFSRAGDAQRSNAAQVANDTGAAASFAPEPDGVVRALAGTGGSSLALGGAFSSVAGRLSPGTALFGGG
jgi:hypothetical protein